MINNIDFNTVAIKKIRSILFNTIEEINLIAPLRKIILEHINLDAKNILDGEVLSGLIHNKIDMNFLIGYLMEENKILKPSEYEADYIIIKAEVNQKNIEALIIYFITGFDCSGCCNALEYAIIKNGFITIGGEISKVYHS